MTFEQWYAEHKEIIHQLTERKQVSFYVWNNKPKAVTARSTKKDDGYTKDFEQFWNEYPSRDSGKGSKAAANVIWNKLKPPIIDCVNTLAWQKQSQQWKNENGKYIPMPTTWLNQRRWEDEMPVVIKHKPSLGDLI